MKESEAALPAPLSPTPQQRGSSDVGGQSEEGGHPSMHTKAGRRGRSQQDTQPLVLAVGAGSAGSAGRFPGGGLGWISGNTVCRMGC